ncbi:uncharacterized protein [Apostichopus japonicus]|uniref:uncharacterized protein n=1 Tax=Stichopus japonicus TaxID=307972 RepID=UPI003AB803B6
MAQNKVASGDVMENIERFRTCPICKKELSDARRLPCAHRFCLKCLDRAVRGFQAKSQGQNFPCPKCQEEVPIPHRGAVDMKKDLWVSEMRSLAELRDKLASNTKSGTCGCCSNDEDLIAYCTDCDGFVCANCCNLHEKIALLKSHTNIFKLDNNMTGKKGKIDLTKLISIMAAPKCPDHRGMELELSCRTCDNCLICLKCALIGHADHEKEEISERVRTLRVELHKEGADLTSKRQKSLACRNHNEKNSEKISYMFENITSGIENKHKLGMTKCEEEEELLTSADVEGMEQIKSGRDMDLVSYEKKAEDGIEAVKREMMNRINAIKEDLDAKKKNRNDHAQRQLEVVEARMNAKKKGINERRQRLTEDKDKLLHVVSSCKKSVLNQLIGCNKTIDEVLIRLKYVSENVDAVQQVSSEWSFVETVSDLLFTMGNMSKTLDDIQVQSQSLNTPALSFDPNNDPYQIGHLMWTMNRKFKVIQGGRFGKNDWKVDDVSSVARGCMVIAGTTPTKESAVDFINRDTGQTTEAKDFLFEDSDPWCLCRANDNRMLACKGSNVEVLNASSGESLRKLSMKKIPRWRQDDRLVSVAYDGNMNEVMVCRQKSNEVFVFDRDLKYLRSFKMPGPSKGPFSMMVSGDMLLACTLLKEGYGIGVDLGTTNVITRFQPIQSSHKGMSICCDAEHLVYILWRRERDVWVVQYDTNGQPMIGLPVHARATLITVSRAKDGSEDLVVGTRDGRLAFYKLPLRKSTALKNHSTWFGGIEQDILDKYLSRRFHWQCTTHNYELKEALDVDLSRHVVVTPPITTPTPTASPAPSPRPTPRPTPPPSMDNSQQRNVSRDYTLLV